MNLPEETTRAGLLGHARPAQHSPGFTSVTRRGEAVRKILLPDHSEPPGGRGHGDSGTVGGDPTMRDRVAEHLQNLVQAVIC